MVTSLTPPELGNQYLDDRVLRSYLRRAMPAAIMAEIEPSLDAMGDLAGGVLYEMQLADLPAEPIVTGGDDSGESVDRIGLTPLWRAAGRLAAERGVVAAAYEGIYGRFARIYQFALAYLFHPSTDAFTHLLATTDGAARTLLDAGKRALSDRAVPHLTSRDPDGSWTGGWWTTGSTGDPEPTSAEIIARRDEAGGWRLYGRQWSALATTSQIALVLARPEGDESGERQPALFYVELRDASGRLHNIQVKHLEDKLGTRKLPTAELTLDGTPAQRVDGAATGLADSVAMLRLTRTWSSITAAAEMRRGVALARTIARNAVRSDGLLTGQSLHTDTLAGLQAETEAAFHLSFYLAGLVGRYEAGEIEGKEAHLLTLLTPIVELTTARQAATVGTEVLEMFGLAGTREGTGLPAILRDSQVFPIWEGTTEVLALDALRALDKGQALAALKATVDACVEGAHECRLAEAGRAAQRAIAHAEGWLKVAHVWGPSTVEAGARRFALTLGRALALALLAEHGQWSLDHEQDARAAAAARRFGSSAVDLIADLEDIDAYALADDGPLPPDRWA